MKVALFAVVLVLFCATGVITLLGLVQRVEIERKYLNGLVSAFLLELTAAVIFLFGATDFFSDESLTDDQLQRLSLLSLYFPDQSTDQIQRILNSHQQDSFQWQRQQDQLKAVQESLVDAQQTIQAQAKAKESLLTQIDWLNDELQLRREAVVKLNRLERQFFVRIAELNGKLGEWGATVNFMWRPEEKRDLALMLQEAFKEIGFLKALEIPNDDPMLTHDILVRYQTNKKFKEVGFLTHQTVAYIVQDYLSSSSSDIR